MAKYKFYQDKETKLWVRDYFTIEAESLEEAIQLVKDAQIDMDSLEIEFYDKVEFVERDMDYTMDCLCNCTAENVSAYEIHSYDLKRKGEESCVWEEYID